MLKVQNNIPSQIKRASSLVLLLILIIISSCTIRKAFQTEFGLNIDKQLNPNKTSVVQNVSCSSDSFSLFTDIVSQSEQSWDFNLTLTSVSPSNELQIVLALNDAKLEKQQLAFSGKVIPLYILHKQMKLCA